MIIKLVSYIFPTWLWANLLAYSPKKITMLLLDSSLSDAMEIKRLRECKREAIEYCGFLPHEGMLVEDCRYEYHTVAVVEDDYDMVTLDDGAGCSLYNCCTIISPKTDYTDKLLLLLRAERSKEYSDYY